MTGEQKQERIEALNKRRTLICEDPDKVCTVANFLGTRNPMHLPESEELLTRLSDLGKFSDGLLSLPIKPVALDGQTQADIYDLQAPNLTNQRDNFYLVAFIGVHKMVSKLVGIEPRTGLTGPKWTEENKKFYRAESFEEVYYRRQRLLTSLHVSSSPAEAPENMDLIMDRVLNDDAFAGVKHTLDKAVKRVFQLGCTEDILNLYMKYFLTELLFFASQAKERTLTFHFGTDMEDVWDLAYSGVLVHDRKAFEALCEMADIRIESSSKFSGLNYQRPSLYPRCGGVKRVKPYDPDPKLSSWIPEIGDDEKTIRIKLGGSSEENRKLLAVGLFYASRDVPELRSFLRGMTSYRRLEECFNEGTYPHKNKFIYTDAPEMLAAASEYFGGAL